MKNKEDQYLVEFVAEHFPPNFAPTFMYSWRQFPDEPYGPTVRAILEDATPWCAIFKTRGIGRKTAIAIVGKLRKEFPRFEQQMRTEARMEADRRRRERDEHENYTARKRHELEGRIIKAREQVAKLEKELKRMLTGP